MHHLETVVVKWWSQKAESTPSTLHCAFSDIQMEFMETSGSGSRRKDIGWEDIILARVGDLPNLGQSEWDQEFGKIECVISLYDQVRWKWDNVYLLGGLLNIYSPSLCLPPQPQYPYTPAIASARCTWRQWSRVFGDAPGDWDQVESKIHMEAGIE